MDLSNNFIKKFRGLVLFTVLVFWCLWKSETVLNVLSFALSVMMPFLIGGAIAFILNVPMKYLEEKLFGKAIEKKKKHLDKLARPLSLVLTLVLFIVLFNFILFFMFPQLANAFTQLGTNFQTFLPELERNLTKLFAENESVLEMIRQIEFDWDSIVQFAINFISNGASDMIEAGVTVAFSIISGMTTFIIAFIFAIYILLQKERLGMQGRKVVFAFTSKGRAEAILEVLRLTNRTFANFLTGQCTEAIIIGTIFAIVLSIFNMPYAILIGVLIAFTALIPVFGAFIGCAMGAFMILMTSPIQALTFVILFFVIQQIEGNLIYPYVVGGSIGLPAIWVLVAVSVGGSLMGVVGMILFIPITSVLYALFREVVYIKLMKNNINPRDIEQHKIG